MNVLFFVLATITIVSADMVPGQACIPGTKFYDQCNTCVCTKDGTGASCTKIMCPLGEYDGQGKLIHLSSKSKRNADLLDNAMKPKLACVPGTKFYDQCNACICSRDGLGTASCTKMSCPPGEYDGNGKLIRFTPIRIDRDAAMRQVCEPGTHFYDKCNSCMCTNSGIGAACTEMMCLPGEYDENGKYLGEHPRALLKYVQHSDEFRCEPGKSFMNTCNTCLCDKNGTSAICTLKACLPNLDIMPQISHMAKRSTDTLHNCVPGRTFKNGCNTCICSKDGHSATCTLMTCLSDDLQMSPDTERYRRTVNDESEFNLKCEPGRMFKQDCNTCVCDSTGKSAACTLMLCIPGFNYDINRQKRNTENWGPIYTPGTPCMPGKKFHSECNSCICQADGRNALCTLMLCPPIVH